MSELRKKVEYLYTPGMVVADAAKIIFLAMGEGRTSFSDVCNVIIAYQEEMEGGVDEKITKGN